MTAASLNGLNRRSTAPFSMRRGRTELSGSVDPDVPAPTADRAPSCRARNAMERGYHVTLHGTIATFTKEMINAAHVLNGPTYGHAILTMSDLVAALPQG